MAIKYNLDHKEIQKRLNSYLENKEWTNQLDNYPLDDNLFKLTNINDHYWLNQLLEEEGVKEPDINSLEFDTKPYVKLTSGNTLIEVVDEWLGLHCNNSVDLFRLLIQLIEYTDNLKSIAQSEEWEKFYKYEYEGYKNIDISVHIFFFGLDDEDELNDLNNYSISVQLYHPDTNYIATLYINDTSALVKNDNTAGFNLDLNILNTVLSSFFTRIYHRFIK